MGNVIPFKKKELKHCSYYKLGDEQSLGLETADGSLSIAPLDCDEFEFCAHGNTQIYTREELAEFLQVAAILIDSQRKWLPELELIGMNYD
jgi:hypothetical protein